MRGLEVIITARWLEFLGTITFHTGDVTGPNPVPATELQGWYIGRAHRRLRCETSSILVPCTLDDSCSVARRTLHSLHCFLERLNGFVAVLEISGTSQMFCNNCL